MSATVWTVSRSRASWPTSTTNIARSVVSVHWPMSLMRIKACKSTAYDPATVRGDGVLPEHQDQKESVHSERVRELVQRPQIQSRIGGLRLSTYDSRYSASLVPHSELTLKYYVEVEEETKAAALQSLPRKIDKLRNQILRHLPATVDGKQIGTVHASPRR